MKKKFIAHLILFEYWNCTSLLKVTHTYSKENLIVQGTPTIGQLGFRKYIQLVLETVLDMTVVGV